MAKSMKYQAVAPDGSIIKFASRSMVYSHAVLARLSYEVAVARVQDPAWRAHDESNFRHFMKYLDGSAGAFEQERAERVLGGARDFPSYQAHEVARLLAAVEEQKAAGKYDNWGLYARCGRLDLAHKQRDAALKCGAYAEVVIAPVAVI